MDFDDLPDIMPGAEMKVGIGNVSAIVCMPRKLGDDGKAACAVVIAPGNPAKHLGSAHAGGELPLALQEACLSQDIGTVRFDYRGVGLSVEHGDDIRNWRIPGFVDMLKDCFDVMEWTKQNVSSTVCFPGFSMSSGFAFDLVEHGLTPVYIGLSIAPLVYKYISPDLAVQEEVKKGNEKHKDVAVPTLWIIGSNDKMSPMQELEPLVEGRCDRGKDVTIKVVEGADHSFTGMEQEAASICAQWIVEHVMPPSIS